MPSKRGVILEHIAAEICAIFPGNVIRVAIDGVDGAGKTTFADELADTIESRPIIVWDYSIYLDVDFENSIPRCALRGEGNPDPDAEQNRRYIEGQKIYIQNCQPRKRASIVLGNNDLDDPFIVS